MKNSLTFPADHVPNYYLGIKIAPDGSFIEVFNGPGAVAWEAVKDRKPPKTNLYSVPIGTLKKLQKKVVPIDRIPRRSSPSTGDGKPSARDSLKFYDPRDNSCQLKKKQKYWLRTWKMCFDGWHTRTTSHLAHAVPACRMWTSAVTFPAVLFIWP